MITYDFEGSTYEMKPKSFSELEDIVEAIVRGAVACASGPRPRRLPGPVPLGALVEFGSDDPTVISADASGAFTLLGNGHVRTELSASYACDATVSGSNGVAGNLQPSVGDVVVVSGWR